ncbi:MAG: T9SS type A sorting domain-containing protein [Saprospiraceae bacterium]|nr:T9SS type A sorting domain-containing protein [Saprospiraceae bacterium]
MKKISSFLWILGIILLHINCLSSQRILDAGPGKTYANMRAACLVALPGDTIVVHAGTYPGGEFIENLKGTAKARITIRGINASSVIYNGGSEALHFIEAEYVTLQNITVTRQTGNGINIDDGGTYITPTKHLLLENIIFKDMNATGNNDMLKLSGLDSFEIRRCTFMNGSAGGSGIDMVGCHFGIIHHNTFISQGSNSIQAKGGSSQITIIANKFTNGGSRVLNLGGSTGTAFFRPLGANYEAKDLFVYSNFFEGSDAPIGYVGSRNVIVSNNTFYNPTKWIFRILQESTDTSFYLSSANNTFSNNIIYAGSINPTVNIGPNTSPTSFKIFNNLWYSVLTASWRGPTLPVVETGAVYSVDPMIVNLSAGNINLSRNSPAIGKGKGPVSYLDYYDRKFSNSVSIGASEYYPATLLDDIIETHEIEVYPNPVKDVIILSDLQNGTQLELIDLQGRVLRKEVSLSSNHVMNLNQIEKGIYFIKVLTVQGIITSKRILKI